MFLFCSGTRISLLSSSFFCPLHHLSNLPCDATLFCWPQLVLYGNTKACSWILMTAAFFFFLDCFVMYYFYLQDDMMPISTSPIFFLPVGYHPCQFGISYATLVTFSLKGAFCLLVCIALHYTEIMWSFSFCSSPFIVFGYPFDQLVNNYITIVPLTKHILRFEGWSNRYRTQTRDHLTLLRAA